MFSIKSGYRQHTLCKFIKSIKLGQLLYNFFRQFLQWVFHEYVQCIFFYNNYSSCR